MALDFSSRVETPTCVLRTYSEVNSRVLKRYQDLDIKQDQGDIRLAACTREGFPCQIAGWAAGYAETLKSLVMQDRGENQ